jgi:hypothetical protein
VITIPISVITIPIRVITMDRHPQLNAQQQLRGGDMLAMTRTVEVGDTLNGKVIAAILGQSESVTVYTTTDKELRWDYRGNDGHVPLSLSHAVSYFDSLMTEIATMVPQRRKAIAFIELGKALFNALEGGSAAGIDDAFKGVREFVGNCALHAARFRYVLAFLAAAVILAGGCLGFATLVPSPPDLSILLIAAASGAAGAAMSVLYRSSRLALDPTAPTGFLIVQGIARAVLGALFGCFIVLA